MDINNPVVKLCSQGMRLEREGKVNEARDLFKQAWDVHKDAYEACIAAHYVARHQSPRDAFYWNKISLDNANKTNVGLVKTFYPSLYLNMGLSYETLNNLADAKKYFELAFQRVGDLPHDEYGQSIRGTILEARKRVGGE